jgi:hypothetical protein
VHNLATIHTSEIMIVCRKQLFSDSVAAMFQIDYDVNKLVG